MRPGMMAERNRFPAEVPGCRSPTLFSYYEIRVRNFCIAISPGDSDVASVAFTTMCGFRFSVHTRDRSCLADRAKVPQTARPRRCRLGHGGRSPGERHVFGSIGLMAAHSEFIAHDSSPRFWGLESRLGSPSQHDPAGLLVAIHPKADALCSL